MAFVNFAHTMWSSSVLPVATSFTYISSQSDPLREMTYAMYLPSCENVVLFSATVPSVLSVFGSSHTRHSLTGAS